MATTPVLGAVLATSTRGPALVATTTNATQESTAAMLAEAATAAPIDYVSEGIKIALFFFLGAVIVIGVVGNIMTIASVAMSRKLQTVPNVYVVNLAITDLAICAMSAPFSIYTNVFSDELRNKERSTEKLCRFMGALTLLCLIMTIVNLALIAANRYILLVRGSKLYVRLFTRRNVGLSVALVYVAAVLGVLPPLVGFGNIGYNVKMGICLFVAYEEKSYWYVQSILHIVIAGPCIFFTVFCYVRILLHFRAAERRIIEQAYVNSASSPGSSASTRNNANGTPPRVPYTAGAITSSDHDSSHIEDCELSSSAAPPGSCSGTAGASPKSYEASYTSVRHKRSRASRRVTFNLLTVFLIFLVCWLPIIIIFTADFYNTIPAVVSHFAMTIALANSCLNVFIYAGMNRGFRKTYLYILRCQYAKLHADLS